MTSGYASAMPPRTARRRKGASACGLMFVRLAHVSRARLTEALDELGLRPAEFAVLHHLAETGASTQLGLARALRIHPSNLVAVLDRLEDAELLDRRRDPADRRRHVVELTAVGADRLRRAEAAALAAEREILEPLAAAERTQLEALLRRLAAHSCGPRGERC